MTILPSSSLIDHHLLVSTYYMNRPYEGICYVSYTTPLLFNSSLYPPATFDEYLYQKLSDKDYARAKKMRGLFSAAKVYQQADLALKQLQGKKPGNGFGEHKQLLSIQNLVQQCSQALDQLPKEASPDKLKNLETALENISSYCLYKTKKAAYRMLFVPPEKSCQTYLLKQERWKTLDASIQALLDRFH